MEQHVARAPFNNRVLRRVGQAVNVAVDRLATIGETIADDYTEIRQSMCEACKEARQAGAMIEHLCEKRDDSLLSNKGFERARRHLLRSITRVLLLTDIVVVRQFLLPKDNIHHHEFSRIDAVNNFTEFTKAFSHFGVEMIELNHLLTGNDQKYPKNEKREAQMFVAKQVLERSAVLLHVSTKTCSFHPDCVTSKENRDTVLCQMRRAMDLVHFIINDGICNTSYLKGRVSDKIDMESEDELSAYACVKHLQKLLEVNKFTMDHTCQEALLSALEAVLESVQDFTDSAYTSQDHREIILENSDRLKSQVHYILGFDDNPNHFDPSFNHGDIENAICHCITTTRELIRNMSNAGALQALELNSVIQHGLELTKKIRQESLLCAMDTLYHTSNAFQDSIDHILEVCKLLRHVLASEMHQVFAKFTEINLRVYGPQVITASKSVIVYPGSKSAEENLDVFADMYQQLLSDVMTIVKNAMKHEQVSEPRVYTSLPRPGKHGTTSKPLKVVRIDSNKPEKIANTEIKPKPPPHELEMSEALGEETLQMHENNDILKKARGMSSMAYAMYEFTKGEGPLQTTQDLFTEAEYFAEEANRLYKNIRQFSYQIPGGDDKKEVLENLDKIPTFLQRLQFAIKDHTVGKAATFTKVDNVIQETKNLMKVICKVTTICLACAAKYKLEFRDSEGGGGRDVDSDTGASCGGGASGDKSGGAAGQDQSL